MCQNFLPFKGWIIFLCTSVLHFAFYMYTTCKFIHSPVHKHLSCFHDFKNNFIYWCIVGSQWCANLCCKQCNSVIHINTDTYLYILFHYGFSQDIEYSSLCYAARPYCLSILNVIAQQVRNLPYSRETRDSGLIPGLGRSAGERNGKPLQYACLENSMDRGAWWATVHGVAKSRTWLTTAQHSTNT